MFAHDRWTRASRRREERPTHHAMADRKCASGRVRWLLAVAMVAVSQAAQAHGIVGNRVCAVKRRRFPVNPTRQPLQPEAAGAAMEVTK
jgi:hypothetical protein